MIKIDVILLGGGNVSYHLSKAFLKASGVNLIQVYNRSIAPIQYLEGKTKITDNIHALKDAAIYIICVSDGAIGTISSQIKKKALVVHTSGSTTAATLDKHKKYGVFYPLQTFSKKRNILFKNIPVCIEANSQKETKLLYQLANRITDSIYMIDSNQRQQIHKAAVFVNNFVNHMYFIGSDLALKNNIDPEILLPLLEETSSKITDLTPFEAQTGPAKRGDVKTIKKHLKKLPDNYKEIYKLLSQSIAKTYGKKL